MLTDTRVDDPRWQEIDLPALAEHVAQAVLVHLGLDPDDWEISLLACDDATITTLNADFRERAEATNVLSWPSVERAPSRPGARPPLPSGPDPELGDIAIAYETCFREARMAGKTLGDHASHLIVHAILHLLGYDHVSDRDATLMETTEVEILGKLGVADPY